jgi:hypothetical protein
MLRRLALSIAMSVLAAACALVDPLPPAGTILVQLEVHNGAARPAELAVTSDPNRPVPDAVQPSSIPPGATADVRFYVPMTSGWTITVNRQDLILSSDMRGRTGVIEDIGIDVDQQGNVSWWCRSNCP